MTTITIRKRDYHGERLHFLEVGELVYDTAFERLEMAQMAAKRISDNDLLPKLEKEGRLAHNPAITVFRG